MMTTCSRMFQNLPIRLFSKIILLMFLAINSALGESGSIERQLDLQELQGIWYSERDVNFTRVIRIIKDSSALDVLCVEGVCGYEDTGVVYLDTCDGVIGFLNIAETAGNPEDIVSQGRYFAFYRNTDETTQFDESYTYDSGLELLSTTLYFCGFFESGDDGELLHFDFVKHEDIPADLRQSLVGLSAKEGRNYIEEFGL